MCKTQQILTVKLAIRFIELCDLRQYSSLTLSSLSFSTVLFHANALSHRLYSKYFVNTLAGTDYVVNLQDFASRNFTVTFLSKQANSTEHVIIIADDQIFEGREYFRLRLSAIRPIGQAAQFFIPQTGFENMFVDINIEDDDSKSHNSLDSVFSPENRLRRVHWTISYVRSG
ncbi:MAG: hypothetical protein MPK62_13110 [Alphaproteobacteria bacterium]|nr:hypothetical protein [Alphaproteobacteria bacterium]